MTIPEEQRIKLESMQIKGIRWMIWNNIEKEDIESRLLQIRGQSSTNDLTKLVNTQSRANLIRLIECSPEITESIIDSAYEKYRYGLKPGFTLFWAKRKDIKTISQEELADKIQEYLSNLRYGDDDKYKNLEYGSIIKFGDTYEVSLSYLQRFNYINPEGEFTFIYMMKECFVWLDTVDKSVVLWYNEEKRTGVFLHGEQLSTARYVRCDVGNSQAVHNRKQGNVGRERKGYPSISEWRVLDFENGSTMERPAAGIW